MKNIIYKNIFLAFLVLTTPLRAAEMAEEVIPLRDSLKVNGFYEHTLKIDKKTPPSKVYLAYPYLRINPEQKVQIVTQEAFSLMGPESSEDIMIVGTLKPCVAVVIFNSENNHTLGFHFHFSNAISDIRNHINKLNNLDKNKLKAYIYSQETDDKKAYNEGFRRASGDRTHFKQMKFIERYLATDLQIPNSSISTIICRRDKQRLYGYLKEYMFADSCIAFKKSEGLPYSVSILHEDIFKFSGKDIRPIDMPSVNKELLYDYLGTASWEYFKFEQLPCEWRYKLIEKAISEIEEYRKLKSNNFQELVKFIQCINSHQYNFSFIEANNFYETLEVITKLLFHPSPKEEFA